MNGPGEPQERGYRGTLRALIITAWHAPMLIIAIGFATIYNLLNKWVGSDD